MKTIQLKDHEVLMIFQSLNSVWWSEEDREKSDSLQDKLRIKAKGNPKLSAYIAKNWPNENMASKDIRETGRLDNY